MNMTRLQKKNGTLFLQNHRWTGGRQVKWTKTSGAWTDKCPWSHIYVESTSVDLRILEYTVVYQEPRKGGNWKHAGRSTAALPGVPLGFSLAAPSSCAPSGPCGYLKISGFLSRRMCVNGLVLERQLGKAFILQRGVTNSGRGLHSKGWRSKGTLGSQQQD